MDGEISRASLAHLEDDAGILALFNRELVPGGRLLLKVPAHRFLFGTLDEAYETLTLIQTGKASMIPIVLLEGEPGYWDEWSRFTEDVLLKRGLISPEDLNLYYFAKTPEDARDHVLHFYRNYHSSRYVRDDLVIRLKQRLKNGFR